MKNYLVQKAVRVERIDQKITSVIKKSAWDKKIRKKFITADNKMTAVDVGDWLLKKTFVYYWRRACGRNKG